MDSTGENAIVPLPGGPGLSYRCPHCLAWFALRFMGNKTRPLKPQIAIYQCIRCRTETRYVTSAHERNV